MFYWNSEKKLNKSPFNGFNITILFQHFVQQHFKWKLESHLVNSAIERPITFDLGNDLGEWLSWTELQS